MKMVNKEDLRKQFKARRLAMSTSEVRDKSRLICEQIIKNTDWHSLNTVHIYKSLPGWNEVDTIELISYLAASWPRLKITQPESRADAPLPKQNFDLVFAPVLAFDDELHRLGWGAGWYDKFLASQPQAIKIGLCFESGHVGKLPAEPHDVALDQIITEDNIYA